MFIVGTDLFVISPLLPRIALEFDLSPSAAGLSVTVFSVTYLLIAPVIGYAADRLGRRRTLICCLGGFLAANLATALSPGLGTLLAARCFAGAAAAGISPLVYAGVGEAAPPERRATWMAIAVSGLLLALSIGAPAGTLIAAELGWRSPFIVLAVISLPLLLANRLAWPTVALSAAAAEAAVSRISIMLLRLLPTVLWATALYGAYTYLGVWLAGAGLSAAEIAQAIGCYGAGALIGTLLGGQAADRFGSQKTMLASLTGLATCLAILGAGIGPGWASDIVLMVLSIFAQLFFPAQQARLARGFPTRRAFVLALNNSCLFLGISLGSLIGGEAMARSGFAADVLAGAVIACGALLLLSLEQRGRSTAA